jgi:hypothetical protein
MKYGSDLAAMCFGIVTVLNYIVHVITFLSGLVDGLALLKETRSKH